MIRRLRAAGEGWLASGSRRALKIWDLLFSPWASMHGRAAWFLWIGIALVYILGVYWYGVFFNWGVHSLFFMDWAEITGPRLTFLRDAIVSGQLPLHMSDPAALHASSYRYLAVADAFTSPQALLMLRMSVTRFNFFNVLILYSAGFWGLLLLAKRLRLSLFTFTAAAMVFNFNGNLLAHYSMGHVTWGGYFLFPFFILFSLRLIQGDRSWRWTLEMAFLLFVIWLQGSFHHYLWLLLFLAIAMVTIRGAFWQCLRTGLAALLLSAVRLIPAALFSRVYSANFVTGYPSLHALWDALTNPGNQLDAARYYPFTLEGVGAWEINAYIGLAAGLTLVVFGVYYGLVRREGPYRKLGLPVAGILLLSLGSFYGWLRLIPLTILQGERVSTRIIAVGLSFLIVIAAERLQRRLEFPNGNQTPRLLAVLGLGITFNELWHSISMWNVLAAEKFSWWIYFDRSKWFVANVYTDTQYIQMLIVGLVISILVFLVLVYMLSRERRLIRLNTPRTRDETQL